MKKTTFRNPDAFEDIQTLLENKQDDIVRDTVSNKKYKCFNTKCRKSFSNIQ